MSEQPSAPPHDDPPEPTSDQPLDDVPAAAGGTDESHPAQGEGEGNSY